MRTTLTLDDEVSLGIKNIQKKNPEKSLKEIVNQVMKKGLSASGERVRVPFKIKPVNAVPKPGLDFDNISVLVSIAEGDFHK